MGRPPIHIEGFALDEVISALQKEIRRSDERKAAFWARLLYMNGYPEYCWKRLMVIISEDIGLADPHLPTTIWALYQMDNKIRKGKSEPGDGVLHLMQAVLMMARASKSRMVGDFEYLVGLNHWNVSEVPDYALCQHTRRGRQKGRDWKSKEGLEFWRDEGSKLVGKVPDEALGGIDYETESWEQAWAELQPPTEEIIPKHSESP